LKTDFGLRFRTVGVNPNFSLNRLINVNYYTSLGLFVSGALFGFSGGLIVHMQKYMDVGMGIGLVIHGLASLMIGESIVGTNTITKQLIAPIIGALLYQQIQGIILSCGLAPSDLKFFTGGIVLLVLSLQRRGLNAQA
jgi:putative tryptophan/tyrosine transport system permease protein